MPLNLTGARCSGVEGMAALDQLLFSQKGALMDDDAGESGCVGATKAVCIQRGFRTLGEMVQSVLGGRIPHPSEARGHRYE